MVGPIRRANQRRRTCKSVRKRRGFVVLAKLRELKEQGASVTKAIEQLQTEPVVNLERIDPTMYNNGYERDYRYPYPQRSRNNIIGNKQRQRWHDDLDVWRPNYDEDDFDHDNWHEYVEKEASYRRYGSGHPQQRGNDVYHHDYDYYGDNQRQNYHFGKSRGYPERTYTSYRWSSINNGNTNRGGFSRSAPNCTATSSSVAHYAKVTSAEKVDENKSNLPCNDNVDRIAEETTTTQAKNKEKESERLETHISLEKFSVAAKQPDCSIVPSEHSSSVSIDVPLPAVYLDVPMDCNDTTVAMDSDFSLTIDSINTRSTFLTKSSTNSVDKQQVIEKGCDEIVAPESSGKNSKVCDSNKVCDQNVKRKCEKDNSINSIKLDKTKTGDAGSKKISDSAHNSGLKSKHTHKKANSKADGKEKGSDLGLITKRKSISNVDTNIPKIPKVSDTQKTESNDNNNLNKNIASSKQFEPKEKAISIEKHSKKRRKTVGDIELPESNTTPKHSPLKDEQNKTNSKKKPKEQQKCETEHKPTEKTTCKQKIVDTKPQAEANPSSAQWETFSDGSKKVPAKIIFRRKTVNSEVQANPVKMKIQPNKPQQASSDKESKKVAAKIISKRRTISADPRTEIVAQGETQSNKPDEEPKKVAAKILLRRKTVDPDFSKTPIKEHRSKSICVQNTSEFEIFHRQHRAKSEGRMTRSKSQELGLNLEILPLPKDHRGRYNRAKTPEPYAVKNRKLKGRFKKILETDDDSDASSVSYNSSSSEKDAAKRKNNRKYHIPKIIPSIPLTSTKLNDPRLKKYQNIPRLSHTDDPVPTTTVHQAQLNKSRDQPNRVNIVNQEPVNRPRDLLSREKKTTLERESSNKTPESRENKTTLNQELPKRLPESSEEKRTSLDREPPTSHRKLSCDEKKSKADPPSSEKKKNFMTVGQFVNELKTQPPKRKHSLSNQMDYLFGADDSDDDSANKSPKHEPVFDQQTLNEGEVLPNIDINSPSTSGYTPRTCKRKLSLTGDDLAYNSKKGTRPWDFGLRSVSNFRDDRKTPKPATINQENNKAFDYKRSSSASQACSTNSVVSNTSTGTNDINNSKKLEQRRLSYTPPVASSSRANNINIMDPRRLSMERRLSTASASGNKSTDNNDIKRLENRRSSNTAPIAPITNIKSPEQKQAITTQVLVKGKQDRQVNIIKSLQRRLSTTEPLKDNRASCSVNDKPYQKSYLDHKMKRSDPNKPSTSTESPVHIPDRPLADNSITLNVTNDKNENYIVHMTDKSSKVVKQQRSATDGVLPEFVQETILGLEVEVYETKTAHKYRQPKGEKLQRAQVDKKPHVEEARLAKQKITKQEKTCQIQNHKVKDVEIIELSSDDEMEAPKTDEIKNVESINNLMREVFDEAIISDTIKPVIATVRPPAAAEPQPQSELQSFTGGFVSNEQTIAPVQPLQTPTLTTGPTSNNHPVQQQSNVAVPAQTELTGVTVRVGPSKLAQVRLPSSRRRGSLSSGSVTIRNATATEETSNIMRNVQQLVNTTLMDFTAVNVNNNQSTTSVCNSNRRITSVSNHYQQTTSICHNNQPTTSVCNSNQPSTSVCNNNQPITNVCNNYQQTTSICNNNQPTTSVCNSNQPSTSICNNNQPTTSGYCNNNQSTRSIGHNNQPIINNVQPVNTNISVTTAATTANAIKQQPAPRQPIPIVNHNDCAAAFAIYISFHINLLQFKDEHYESYRRLGVNEEMLREELFDLIQLPKNSLKRLAKKFVKYFETHHIENFNCKLLFRYLDYYINEKFSFKIPARIILRVLFEVACLMKESHPMDFTNSFYNDMYLMYFNRQLFPMANGMQNQNNPAPANQNNPALANQNSNAPRLQNANQSQPNPQQQAVPYRQAIGSAEQNAAAVPPQGNPMTPLQRLQLNTQINEYLRLCVAVEEPAQRPNQRGRRRSRPSADLAIERQLLHQLLQQQRLELPPQARSNEGWRSQSQGTSSSQSFGALASAIPAAAATSVATPVAAPIAAPVAAPVAPAATLNNCTTALQLLNQQVTAMVRLETSNNVQRTGQHPTMRWQPDVGHNTLQHTSLAAMDRYVPPNVTISAQQNPNLVEQMRGRAVASSTFVPPPGYYQSNAHIQVQQTLEQRLMQPRCEEREAPFPVPNDNFRIRLPMSRPLEPQVAANPIPTPTTRATVIESTSVTSTNTMCGTTDATTAASSLTSSSEEYTLKQELIANIQDPPLSPLSVADSTDSVILESVDVDSNRRAPSPTRFVKCEAIEKEIIDVDEWLDDRLGLAEDIGYTVKKEMISQLQINTEQVTTDNLPGGQPSTSVRVPPPRIASVDSGISSPPRQMEHPEIMLDRICICSKKAELVCQCKMAIYCSRECQINNWPNHQELCLRTRKEYA